MKIPNQRQHQNQLHIRVQIMMLENDISRKIIMKKLKMSKSLLSKALKGERKGALDRVAQFVQSHSR